MRPTHGLVVHTTTPLGQPVVNRCGHREDRTGHHHVVEVRDHKIGVVILEVSRRNRQHQAGKATQSEQNEKADAKQHGRLKAQRTAPHS